ncbi:hypothetical protein D9757_009997 [Collybiopsis confluens]|uniref:RNA helicase n=1 Tax=Collybiopsis confluens TaxID=2823264 RepID=A0A8H5GUU3_9AGAR|nr:hypothetical protein D9757_009997 [Collybiopsis confluens]
MAPTTFSSLSHLIDTRILKSLADLGFARPTTVQAKSIPLALEGKDIVARAKTGSGKTAAYCVPALQKILTVKNTLDIQDPTRQCTRCLILVPTRELSEQVTSHIKKLSRYCDNEISVVNASASSGTKATLGLALGDDKPDIVVATPARAVALFQAKALIGTHLDSLIIDEADLVLSYGHSSDLQHLLNNSGYLPKIYQSFLMSATMSEDVDTLKGMLTLRDPIFLMLDDDEDDEDEGTGEAGKTQTGSGTSKLTQYFIRTPTDTEKFLILYISLKLSLIKGKTLIFVNGDVDRSYRIKLFLEQFGIRSCVLNKELPGNSRYHTVQEFNKGVYDYIIATDEGGDMEDDDDEGEEEGSGEEAEEEEEEIEEYTTTQRVDPSSSPTSTAQTEAKKRKRTTTESGPSSKRVKSSSATTTTSPDPSSNSTSKSKLSSKEKQKQKEYSVTRGVDFIDVSCVINFDVPTSSRSYTHRVGRTARAGRTGVAISFVGLKEEEGGGEVEHDKAKAKPKAGTEVGTGAQMIKPFNKEEEGRAEESKVWRRILRDQERKHNNRGRGNGSPPIKEYKFDKKQIDAFRYRMEDALRSVTRARVREARVKELKMEILNSERLKAHFEDNPLDLEYLRHDKPLHPSRIQPHMKYVPKYLMPKIGGGAAGATGSAPLAPDTEEETGRAGAGADGKGFIPFRKQNHNRGRGGRGRGGRGGGGRGGRGRSASGGKKKSDPLKKFGR